MKPVWFGLAVAAVVGLASCSDDFLREKRDYSHADPKIYNDYSSAVIRVNSVYAYCLPDVNGTTVGASAWKYPYSAGLNDDLSKCTEEYSGFGIFVNPEYDLNTTTGTKAPDYFGGTFANVQANVWGVVRMINDTIEGVEGSTLSETHKNELLGQLYFLRAWRNFITLRWYGAIPIVDKVLEVDPSSTTPRASAKACFDFILSDLAKSVDMLEAAGFNKLAYDSNYGRVTTGTALAFKGRVLTWWCSPLFNRAGDQSRYEQAYEEMKADLARIDACGYGLAQASSTDNYAGWADLFQKATGDNPEAIFFTRYNNVAPGGTPDYGKNNPWERKIRPANAYGGGMNPSAMIVDLFPMSDGGIPDYADYFGTASKLKRSSISYDMNYPFMNRDPRFYRTFGFPGIKWPYNGNVMGDNNKNPFNGDDYELWNYVWYLDDAERDNAASSSQYGADNLLKDVKGMYITKRSTGKVHSYRDVNKDSESDAFSYSYASYIELRYAEVLLNFAEVACGANKLNEAYENLRKIRQRVGYTGDCGITTGSQAECMAAILYERQIEFAFEGKRFEDMRRWMLFDGGSQTVAGAPSTWTLTGWGGNTCTWLGFKPFNGQHRDNMEFRVNDANATEKGADTWGEWDNMPDPIAKTLIADEGSSVTNWNTFKAWRSGYAVDLNNTSSDQLQGQLEHLKEFYSKYLIRKTKTSDTNSSSVVSSITFRPRYYILGLPNGTQSNNTALLQTYGWEDTQGHSEYCDPFAE